MFTRDKKKKAKQNYFIISIINYVHLVVSIHFYFKI